MLLMLRQLLATMVNIQPAFTEEMLNVRVSDVHLPYVERHCKTWLSVASVTDIVA